MSNQNFIAHTVAIHQGIGELASMTVGLYEEVFEALIALDATALSTIGARPKGAKELAGNVDNKIVATLALYSPEAEELRRLIAYLKVSERWAKAYEVIRKFSKRIAPFVDKEISVLRIHKDIVDLALSSKNALLIAQQACMDGDADMEVLKSQVIAEESKSDDLFSLIHKDIILSSYKEEVYVRASIEFFNASRRLERGADVAVEIVKLISYAKHGGRLEED